MQELPDRHLLLMLLELADTSFDKMIEEQRAVCASKQRHISTDLTWLRLMWQQMVEVRCLLWLARVSR